MKFTKATPTLFLLIFLTACVSPKKKFDAGDYEAAFKASLKNLKNEKKATPADQDFLVKSLDKIYLTDRKEIGYYETTKDWKEWEKAYKINNNLLDKIEAANPYVSDKFAFNYQKTLDKEAELRNRLADELMAIGQEHLDASIETGNKFLAQDAFNYFRKAEKYGVSNIDLIPLYQLCYDYGTVVYRVSAYAPFNISYNWDIDRTFENVRSNRNFLQVLYEQNTPNIDCDIQLDFKSLDINETRRETSQDFEKSIITGYHTVTDTSGFTTRQEIRETIRGTVKTTNITKKAQWRVYVYIKGYSNNCRLSESNWCVGTESKIEEYDLSGDQRAIPQTYKGASFDNLTSDDDMAEELIEEIFRRFQNEYF